MNACWQQLKFKKANNRNKEKTPPGKNRMTQAISMTSKKYLLNVIFVLLLTTLNVNNTFALELSNDEPVNPADLDKSAFDYIGLGAGLTEFGSVNIDLVEVTFRDDGTRIESPQQSFTGKTAQTYSSTFILGTNLNKNFRSEIRIGKGIKTDSITPALEVEIKYFVSWYMAGVLPITDYLSAYAQFGFSTYKANVTRKEITITTLESLAGFTLPTEKNVQPSEDILPGLFGSNFSTSWMLGMDYILTNRWYLSAEYGNLLSDTGSNIKVYQANLLLRYEY